MALLGVPKEELDEKRAKYEEQKQERRSYCGSS